MQTRPGVGTVDLDPIACARDLVRNEADAVVLDQSEDRPLVIEVDAVVQREIRGGAVHRTGIEIEVSERGCERTRSNRVFPLATGPADRPRVDLRHAGRTFSSPDRVDLRLAPDAGGGKSSFGLPDVVGCDQHALFNVQRSRLQGRPVRSELFVRPRRHDGSRARWRATWRENLELAKMADAGMASTSCSWTAAGKAMAGTRITRNHVRDDHLGDRIARAASNESPSSAPCTRRCFRRSSRPSKS